MTNTFVTAGELCANHIGTREFKWTGYDIRKNSGYDGHTVAPVILDRIRRYETDVAGFNHGSTLVFGGEE